jgi:hypothetical protein
MFVGSREHNWPVLIVLISLNLSFYQVHVVFQCAKMFEMGEKYVWWKLGLQ